MVKRQGKKIKLNLSEEVPVGRENQGQEEQADVCWDVTVSTLVGNACLTHLCYLHFEPLPFKVLCLIGFWFCLFRFCGYRCVHYNGFYVILGIELRALCMPGNYPAY